MGSWTHQSLLPNRSGPESLALRLRPNQSGRDFVAGELGRGLAHLEHTLSCLGFNTRKDRLICVGSLFGDGVTAACLTRFLSRIRTFAVRGPREQMVLHLADTGRLDRADLRTSELLKALGAGWWLAADGRERTGILNVLRSMPVVIEVGDRADEEHRLGFAHDGPIDGMSWPAFFSAVADQDGFAVDSAVYGGYCGRHEETRAGRRRRAIAGVSHVFVAATKRAAAGMSNVAPIERGMVQRVHVDGAAHGRAWWRPPVTAAMPPHGALAAASSAA